MNGEDKMEIGNKLLLHSTLAITKLVLGTSSSRTATPSYKPGGKMSTAQEDRSKLRSGRLTLYPYSQMVGRNFTYVRYLVP